MSDGIRLRAGYRTAPGGFALGEAPAANTLRVVSSVKVSDSRGMLVTNGPDDPPEAQRDPAAQGYRFTLDVDAAVAFEEAPVAVDAPQEAAIVPDRQLALGQPSRRR